MGTNYTNATVYGPSQDIIVAEVRHIPSFVIPTRNNMTVIFPDVDSLMRTMASPDDFLDIWRRISQELACPVFTATVFDSDALVYWLWDKGELIATYTSDPHLADPSEEENLPNTENAKKVCAIFSCNDAGKLAEILAKPPQTDTYLLEEKRHADIVDILGLPHSTIGMDYTYIKRGELPNGISLSDLIETPDV